MRLLEFFKDSKKKQVKDQVSRAKRVDHESTTSQLRANYERLSSVKGTDRSLFDLVSLSSRSRAILLTLLFSLSCVNMWGDVVWQSDMQETISGVTVTKLNNSDTWATGLDLAWAPGFTKAYQPSGSGRGVQLEFGTPLSLQTGDVIRVFAGGTNNTARTLSLFLNDGGSAVGTVSLPNGTLRVLDYALTSGLNLSKIKITSNNGAVYIFKVQILSSHPTTGETTVTYEMEYKGMNVQGRTDNCISTITGLSTAFTRNSLTTSTSNGVVSFSGEITGHPTSEDASKNVDLQFTIADGYTFTPSSVSFKWDGNNSSVKAKVTITDGTTSVTSNESTASGSVSTSNAKSFSFASGAFSGISFSGTVHIKVHIWSSATGKRAYILSPFSISGVIAPAASCSTPDPPTATSNGEATSISQPVSWTDASNEKWDVIVSTSSSTPAADATPTASNLTSKSYTFTGLSASTTYYWWVRSVCDATHKSTWYAGSSFTTPALVTYTLTTTVGTSGAATGGATITNGVVASIPSGTTVTNNGDNTFTINTASPTTVTASASVSGVAGPDDDACTYAFTGWENLPATVTADVSNIHALYEARFAIGFKETDGTAVAGVSSTYYVYGTGKVVSTFPTPTKSGYTFAGWYTDVALTTPATDLDNESYGAIDYYAKWNEVRCAILSCGNATLTYVIKTGSSGSHSTGGADLITSATASNTTALGASTTPTYQTITMSDLNMKAAAAISTCFPSKPNMSGKISCYNGTSYSSSNYLQFTFTVKEGYTFTPCDIQFVVQPVDQATNFRWEVTDGSSSYGYGIATDVAKGSDGGASVLTGLSSTSQMSAGTYYIRLYPYVNAASKTFRLGTDVILKGTTAAASCSAPTSPAITGSASYNVGAMMNLTASATGTNGSTTYTWYKGATWDAASATTPVQATSTSGATYTISGCVAEDAGTYWCNISNGTDCDVQVSHAITVSGACTKPGKPQLPRVEDGTLTHNGARFSWDRNGATANSDGYVVSVVKKSPESTVLDWTSTGIYTDGLGGYLFDVTGLTEETTYYFVVKAIGADGFCEYGDTARVEFTTGASSAGDCEDYAVVTATSTSAVTASVGSVTYGSMTTGDEINIDGYTKSVKFNSSGYVAISPKAGEEFEAGDSLIVVIYNHGSNTQTIGFKIGDNDYTASTAGYSLHYFRQTLIAANIADDKVTIRRSATNGSSGYIVAATIKRCGLLPACTTPVLPTLSDQNVCPGDDIAAWDATATNAAAITAAGESIAYSWKKKGNDTELATTASFDLGSSATEGQAGIYVVTATVSKAGYASSTASKEVTLSVTAAVEEPSITASKATVYTGNEVTLTATCGTGGVTWSWFTCSNAEGDDEEAIGGATSNAYTIASAPAAGTYYYKVKATGSCSSASKVYTLTVSVPSECENYFWFVYSSDATNNSVVNNRENFFGSSPKTGSSNSGIYKFTLDGTEYTATRNTGSNSFTIPFTVPADATATLAINCKGSSSNPIYLIPTSGDTVLITSSSSMGAHVVEDIAAGTYKVGAKKDGSASWTLAGLAVQVCSTSSCTDATPTIAAVNNSVCVRSKIKLTSTGYATGATFQWQKLNGNTWDNVAGATLDSLVIVSAAAGNAGSYRLVAHKDCNRTSNTVTIAVPSAPVFGAVTSPRSVMATQTLSISDVEASDATGYKWYQSTDATFDAGDTQIGTTKNLTKTYADEAIASPSYYLFCVATNSCGADTTSAIAVNVTEIVDEECANRGGEGEAAFGFVNTSCSQVTYSETACWQSGGRAYYLTYSAPTGKYLKVAKVTVAVSSNSKCGVAYSTNGGSTWTFAELTGLSSTLTEKTINLSAYGNVTNFRIGRNLQDGSSKDWGITEGKFYLSRACFEYSKACTSTSVTPSTSSKDHTIGDSFTEPTFTVKHGNTAFAPQPTITYTSSNEDVATVDDDGTVNFQGKGGIVKITASYAGDETYCASEGYYTINVSCPGGAPKIVAAGGTNMSGCNTSVTLLAKQQDGTSDFADGTYQWFRDGKEISGATSASYTALQAGVYTVERTNTSGCTTPSTNSATITSEVTEPEVERLTPFQYYHVDSVYPAASIMRYRHLFAVKNSGTKNDKIYQMEMSRNRGALTDVTNSNALVMDADTVLLDLNKLNGKYSEGDTLKFICHAIDCNGNASNTYKDSIYVYVINKTRSTLALILNGKGGVVGGDFFDYEPQNLQQQTGASTWSGEWSMYTELKEDYIVTPVSGYAQFNKLNYEPFDIVFLTDFPKASKSAAAATVLDDMADLCDFRPLFSFKTHMVHKSPSKWAAKGFTTSPVSDTKNAGKLNLNIVCYAHPMFDAIKSGEDVYTDVENSSAPLVYKMLSGEGYESSKGMQGFEIADAENFVTIGLTHHDATITYNSPNSGDVTWAAGSTDRMLVTVAERQTNIEARMILFSLNAGAHSKLTDKGEQVVLACLRYLLKTDPMAVADCSFTFDNGASNEHDAAWYTEHCSTCTGTKGDHKWTTAANWAPSYNLLPGEFTSVRIEAAAVVDTTHAHVMEIRIKEGGSIEIPVGKALDVKSTIRRLDGSEISPTENSDIYIASEAGGNGTLIFNNNTGDTKAVVAMYTTAKTADPDPVTGKISAAASTWQYIGTPHSDVVSALHNYYDAWLYQQNGEYSGWTVIPNGGPLETFRGYCVTHPQANHTFIMEGTLAATTSQDIDVPAGKYVVMANSWVAPIDIKLLTDNDFENITDKSVYFFNTGSDPEGTGTVTSEEGGISEETRWAASTYVSVPIHAASYTGKDDHIPSMQGFYVVGGSSNGTLHLDYDRHVRKSSRGYASGRMHAPKRSLAAADGEPEVAKLFFRGNRYDDRLVVLERADFTEGYDSGWDGEAWGGNDAAPMSYVSTQGRQDAVSAVPEYEGTLIGFRAGEDSEYLINFVYSPESEPLYLYDTETNQYSQVVTGNAYHFTTSDKKAHERFILTRTSGYQTPTGIGETDSGKSKVDRARKLLIDQKMFILVNGVLYDATGKVVK